MDYLSRTKTLDKELTPSRRPRSVLALAAIALGLWVSNVSPSYAQLRTGRIERSLYQDERQSSKRISKAKRGSTTAGNTKSRSNRTQSKVVPAAYSPLPQGETEVPPSVTVESQPLQPIPSEYMDPAGAVYFTPTNSSVRPGAVGPLLALWYRTRVRAEVPLFWRRDQGPPPLVTTSPTGTAASIAGELGQPTTETLLGGVLNDEHSTGVRLTFETWIGGGDNLGLMVRYWNAGDKDDSFGFDSNTNAILARPFLDTSAGAPGTQETQLIAFPGEAIGNINVSTTSALDGLDVIVKRLLYRDRFTRIDWTYGFQRILLEEGLTISSDTTVTGTLLGLTGTSIAVSDSFQTENEFNGVTYGIMSTRRVGYFIFESMFRLGVGNLRREVMISGSTTTTSGGASATDNQGLLARNTNNQGFTDDTLVVVPEAGINFAYLIRPGVHFNLGYNFMLVPKVAQAAQQIDNDLAVNLTDPITGTLDPALDFTERDYWINSLGLGFQIRY